MGHREVRPVPLDWEHPTDGITRDGKPRYVALFSRESLRWNLSYYAEHPEYTEGEDAWTYRPEDYMPEIPEGTPLGWQLYETTSEGTPVSPVFATLEELAQWCETGATVFASLTWTAEQWLASFRNGTTDVDSLAYWSPGQGIHTGDPLQA